jgi:hypothetical protein
MALSSSHGARFAFILQEPGPREVPSKEAAATLSWIWGLTALVDLPGLVSGFCL